MMGGGGQMFSGRRLVWNFFVNGLEVGGSGFGVRGSRRRYARRI